MKETDPCEMASMQTKSQTIREAALELPNSIWERCLQKSFHRSNESLKEKFLRKQKLDLYRHPLKKTRRGKKKEEAKAIRQG